MRRMIPQAIFGLAMLAATSANAAEAVGRVVGVTPAARGTVAGTLDLGKAVYRDETLSTGARAAAEVRLDDDTRLGVGPNARLRLDDFVLGGARPAVTVRMVRGTFRFITGSADKRAYRLVTPLAVVGVRGTELGFVVGNGFVDVTLYGGAADVCPNGRACLPLETINQTLRITAGGAITRRGNSAGFALACRDTGTEAAICRSLADDPTRILDGGGAAASTGSESGSPSPRQNSP